MKEVKQSQFEQFLREQGDNLCYEFQETNQHRGSYMYDHSGVMRASCEFFYKKGTTRYFILA